MANCSASRGQLPQFPRITQTTGQDRRRVYYTGQRARHERRLSCVLDDERQRRALVKSLEGAERRAAPHLVDAALRAAQLSGWSKQ